MFCLSPKVPTSHLTTLPKTRPLTLWQSMTKLSTAKLANLQILVTVAYFHEENDFHKPFSVSVTNQFICDNGKTDWPNLTLSILAATKIVEQYDNFCFNKHTVERQCYMPGATEKRIILSNCHRNWNHLKFRHAIFNCQNHKQMFLLNLLYIPMEMKCS